MPADLPDADALQRRLPLPLAQLHRRACNAQTALQRHLAAHLLWEASLKLLASVAVIEYARRGPAAPDVAEPLKSLARPSLGHWWKFVRLLVPALADAGDPAFVHLRDGLLGKPRSDCPRAAGLDALLREVLENKPGARATVQLAELFNRLVTLRNKEMGHGAAGQRPAAFYERSAPAMLAGVSEVLDRLDVLAGRRLVHAADLRRLAEGNWLVERFDLSAETVRRIESLPVPEADAVKLPRPGRLYLCGPDESAAWQSLHPLLTYDAETERVFFLNSRAAERRAEYLCYTTGDVVKRDELGQDQRELRIQVLGGPVDSAAVQAWAVASAAGEAPPPAVDAPPRTVGEFELISRLGRGGMGVVYRAWQPSLGRQVALKCLMGLGDPKAEARFAHEIRAQGSVKHPHLIDIYTEGKEGDRWFYAMELVEGPSLASVLYRLSEAAGEPSAITWDAWQGAVSTAYERGRRAEEPLVGADSAVPAAPTETSAIVTVPTEGRGFIWRAAELVRQVAEAAHALHESGIIHRDIKPSNILLTADGGHAVLADLGLAQLADESEGRLTRTEQFVGTLRYASPEQMLATKLDRRADVYALGATLWELLTLRPLYGATDQTPTPELMLKIQTTDPERVRKHNPRVPADLEAIVARCLEKDRARRYATAAELAADLGQFLGGPPIACRRPTSLLTEATRRWTNWWSRPSVAGRPSALPPVERTAPKPESPRIDLVTFSLTGPSVLTPGKSAAVIVWAHLDRHLAEVERRARREIGADIHVQGKSGVRVPQGAGLTVRLQVPELGVADPEDDLAWDGDIANARFLVTPPKDAASGSYPGRATIHLGGAQIAKLAFTLEVGGSTGPVGAIPTRQRRHHTAFASYASADREEVLARLQGMKKVAPHLDVFIDVLSLRSGRRRAQRLEEEIRARDVFYLFWSLAASRSEWVDKEWRTALRLRGIEYIDPFPFAAPDHAPPPPELAELHFNDWLLAFRSAKLARRPWWKFW